MTKKWFIILSAVLGGLLLNYLNIPAGALVGSMLGTAAAQVILNKTIDVPPLLKRIIRVIMGCYIGLGITAEGMRQLKDIPGAIAIIIIGMAFVTLLTAILLQKLCRWGTVESFLGSLPAGLTEIGMNAEDFKVDPITVTTVHLMRLITILTFIPLILKILY